MRFSPALVTVAALIATPAAADEIAETMRRALAAYEAGDATAAAQDLAIATQMLQQQKAQALTGFLPPAPDGWTRSVDTEMNAGLAMTGGGTGAAATYEGPEGSFTLTITADSPMMMSFMGLFANPMILQSMGQVSRLGDQMVLQQDADLMTLVDNRILVQATGLPADTMRPVFEAVDFAALAAFGR